MVKSDKIANAFKRSEVHRKGKRDKEQEKLKRRMETRKAGAGEGGDELKRVSLSLVCTLGKYSRFGRKGALHRNAVIGKEQIRGLTCSND